MSSMQGGHCPEEAFSPANMAPKEKISGVHPWFPGRRMRNGEVAFDFASPPPHTHKLG